MFTSCFFSKQKNPDKVQKVNKTKRVNNSFNIHADTVTQDKKKRLGGGVSGNVIRGQWANKDVAIKLFDDSSSDDYDYYAEKEIAEYLGAIKEPSNNIIKYYGCIENVTQRSLIIEYMPKGDLKKYIFGNNTDIRTSLFIARDIAHGLQYLRQYKIIHCDIKLENILLNDKFHAKICDFGNSIFEKDSMHSTHQILGTTGYIAPELIKAHRAQTYLPYTYSIDVYAFGVLLYEVISLKYAYGEHRNKKSIYNEVAVGIRPSISANCPKDVANIIRFAWHDHSKKRAKINDIVDGLERICKKMKN